MGERTAKASLQGRTSLGIDFNAATHVDDVAKAFGKVLDDVPTPALKPSTATNAGRNRIYKWRNKLELLTQRDKGEKELRVPSVPEGLALLLQTLTQRDKGEKELRVPSVPEGLRCFYRP